MDERIELDECFLLIGGIIRQAISDRKVKWLHSAEFTNYCELVGVDPEVIRVEILKRTKGVEMTLHKRFNLWDTKGRRQK